MKQKTMFLTLAASAMIAASFTSCSRDDNPIGEAIPSPVVDNFDEGSVIKNGTCEGSLVENYWVNIGQDGAQYAGPATIKKEKRADNHCIEVDVRSEEEARAAGNFGAQTWADPNAYADHDTQFFITFGEEQALNNKDQIRITMDIKADEPFTAATGAHAAPGAYLSGFNNVNVNFTTEWASFDTGWITATGNPKVGTYSIAFNLAKGFANKVYFDNIRVEIIRFIPDPEPEKIEGMKVIFWNWGLAKEDQLSVKYFKNYTAPVAEDGAIVVESLEPGKVYTQYYMADNNGNQIDAVLTNDWDTQFLIGLPEPLPKGTKGKLVMKVKADKATKAGTQCHKAIPAPGAIEGKDGYAGTYMHWAFLGDITFTETWETVAVDFTVPDDGDGVQSICLNLEGLREVNKYYFDDIAVYVEKGEEPEPEMIEGYNVIFWNWGKADDTQLSTKYFKNYTSTKIEDGVIIVESLEPSKNYNEQYYNQDNDAVLANDHDTQFLISLPQPLGKGTKGKLVMKVKADKAAKAGTQCHKAIPAPGAIEGKDGYTGTYIHWAFMGDINFTTEWNTVSVDFTVPDDGDGVQAICLNLEVLREVNKYYFDDITVYVEK